MGSVSAWCRRACTGAALAGAILTGEAVSAAPMVAGGQAHELVALYGERPLEFEPNRGQFDRRVKFAARRAGGSVFVTDSGISLTAARGGREAAPLRLRFDGATPRARFVEQQPLAGKSNYFIGNKSRRWHTDVPHFGRVVEKNAYRGIDVAYYGVRGGLEYDLVLTPGADASAVRLVVEGATAVELAPNGDLVMRTAAGDVRQHRPTVYQGERSAPEIVAGAYRLARTDAGTEVRFEIGAYDRERALVLDPALDFGTYFGGAGDDNLGGLALDANGDIYIAGWTTSDQATFPVTAGAYQTVKGMFLDAFVAKIKGDGSQLVYVTYVGGDGNDVANGVAVDASGQAVLGGETGSSNYPLAAPVQNAITGGTCGVVTKLNASGNGLVFSTYLGGNQVTQVYGVATDASLATYVTGRSFFNTSFPTTAGAFQTAVAGSANAFVVKYAANGARVYSTLLGAQFEAGNWIGVDAAGSAYVVGTMTATAINGVTAATIGPGGGGDAMLAKLAPSAASLGYLTRIGGSDVEEGVSGSLDGGTVYFTGRSFSADLPSVPPAPGATNVALFGALNPSGSALTGPGLTWYGDTAPASAACAFGGAIGTSLAIDAAQRTAYVVGYGCPAPSFPVVAPIADLDCTPNCASSSGGFLLKYRWSAGASAAASPKATQDTILESATPIAGGANTNTQYKATALAPFGNLLLGLNGNGTDPTRGAIDPTQNGEDDAYIARVRPKPPQVAKAFLPPEIEVGGTTTLHLTVVNPNPDVTLTRVYIDDVLPDGLFITGSIRDEPAGCNGTLDMRDLVADEGLDLHSVLSNRRHYEEFVPGEYYEVAHAGATLPPGSGCTIIVTVHATDANPTTYHNVTGKPTCLEVGDGEAASADLTTIARQTWTWTGNVSNAKSASGNWQNASAPASGAAQEFPAGAVRTAVTDDLPATDTIGRAVISGPGYQFSGGTRAIDANVLALANTQLGTPLAIDGEVTFDVAPAVSALLSGGLQLGNGSFLYILSHGDTMLTGPTGGAGTIIKQGSGTLTVDPPAGGDPSYRLICEDGICSTSVAVPVPFEVRSPAILGGTGSIGAVTSSGVVEAGSPSQPYGMLTVASYSAGATSSLRISAQAAAASHLAVSGAAALAGSLHLTFDALPAVGASYVVLSAGALTGQFARALATPSNVFGNAAYSGANVTYTVVATDGLLRAGFE